LNNAGINTTYKFPCARFSPMDFFQEARWFFEVEDRVTWYTEVAKKAVVAPRIPRFGVMSQVCSNLFVNTVTRTECNAVVMRRIVTNEPLRLMSDIGSLEMNDPCKQCIENEVEIVAEDLLAKSTEMFTSLAEELRKANQTELADTCDTILSKMSLESVIDYYSYKTIRFLYGLLGGPTYLESFTAFQELCSVLAPEQAAENCGDIDLQEAVLTLGRHADHAFSSTSSAGSPLPFWGDDGDGYLFQVRVC
jgi:hypothetical protein